MDGVESEEQICILPLLCIKATGFPLVSFATWQAVASRQHVVRRSSAGCENEFLQADEHCWVR